MANRIVSPLTLEDVPELAAVLAQAFCRNNAFSRHFKLDEQRYAEWAGRLARAYLSDGNKLSFVVRDKTSNRVIGGVLTRLLSNKTPPIGVETAMTPIVLAKLKNPSYVMEADPTTVMDVAFVGGLSVEEGGQKGITATCLDYTLKAGKESAVRYATCDLTSPVTQHVFVEKYGFKIVDQVIFAESGIPEYEGCPGKAYQAVLDLSDFKPK